MTQRVALTLLVAASVAAGCTAIFGIDGNYVEGTAGGGGGGCSGADLENDEQNCGACGVVCPGTVCLGGECTTSCVLPFENCDQNIGLNGCEADLTSDPGNCGACGFACPVGATCVASQCECPAGKVDCDGFPENGCEADPMTDAAHCGACNQPCGPGQDCLGGECACAPGSGDCNQEPRDGCEASLAAVDNCGACGMACGAHQVCSGTACECAAGFLDCLPAADGCESPASSPDSCGMCGVVCDPGMVCNGVACAATCNPGQTQCDASCVDLLTDPLNCGACGAALEPNQVCSGGVPECAEGYADCSVAPGCETATTNDPLQCGACNMICKPGALCVQGLCVCAASTPNDCGDECRFCCDGSDCGDGDGCTTDVCSDDGTTCLHGGCDAGTKCCSQLACGVCCSDAECGDLEICSGGVCSPGCSGGKALCDGQCVDLMTDPTNCNGCNLQCGADGTCGCNAGVCSGGTIYFSEDFSNNANGWTLGPLWGIGPATASSGQQAGNPDPDADHSSTADDGVAGVVIGGNVTMSATTYLESPAIDTSSAGGTLKLTFWRWLNSPAGANVSVQCWAGKDPWKTLWLNANVVTDSGWTRFEYNAAVCESSATRVRFALDTNVVGSIMSGWNIDDVTLSSATCD